MNNAHLNTILFFLLVLTQGKSQNTLELFSLPGLTISSSTSDDIGQISRGSTFYIKDTIIEGVNYLEYHNKNCYKTFYRVDGFKVYQKNLLSVTEETLIQDYGAGIGDTIELNLFFHPSGFMKIDAYVVLKTYTTFLDGRARIRMELASDDFGGNLEWVEGIGQFNFSRNIECVKDVNGSIYLNSSESECNKLVCKDIILDYELEFSDNTVYLTNKSKHYDEIEWSMGDDITYTDNDVNHEYLDIGCREITLSASNSCGQVEQVSIPFENCSDSLWVLHSNRVFKEISMINELEGFAITIDSVFRTINSGLDWMPVDIEYQNDSIPPFFKDIKMSGDYGIIVIGNSAVEPDVLITNDRGIQWAEVAIPGLTYKLYAEASIDRDGNKVLITGNRVYSTDNSNNTWDETRLMIGGALWGGKLYQEENGLVVYTSREETDITRSIIHVSLDYGKFFNRTIIDNNSTMNGISFVENTGYITTDRGILKTTDKGYTWTEVVSFNEYKNFRDIHFSDENNGILISIDNIYRTSDGGHNWEIEYCQNEFKLQGLDVVDDYEIIRHLEGISKYNPERDFSCTTSVTESESFDIYNVYPNPTIGVINISTYDQSIESVTLIDMYGSVIEKFQNQRKSLSIDMSQLSSGLYYLSIEDTKGINNVQKVIKI